MEKSTSFFSIFCLCLFFNSLSAQEAYPCDSLLTLPLEVPKTITHPTLAKDFWMIFPFGTLKEKTDTVCYQDNVLVFKKDGKLLESRTADDRGFCRFVVNGEEVILFFYPYDNRVTRTYLRKTKRT